MAITGPSGAGKTTLLSAVLGLLRTSSGSILVGDQEVTRLRGRALERLRRQEVGMVFQHAELMPELDPVENVAVAALLDGRDATQAWAQARALLAELGVPLDRARTADLSGGERQRVALARALMNRPRLVLADEPTGALDADTRDAVADMVFDLPRRWGAGLVVVTHDPQVAARADAQVRLVPDEPMVAVT